MQTNIPVNGVDIILGDADTLISKSDANGKLTYVNQDFVAISGYSEEEVLGRQQDILVDPDAPAEVFADFLRTVKARKAWTAVVRNRRKDGAFFWVQLTAAPLFEEHQIVGYTSIRTKPDARSVHAATSAYKAMRAGSNELSMDEGRIVRRSTWRRFAGAGLRFQPPSLFATINLSSALLAIILLANLAELQAAGGPAWLSLACVGGLACCFVSPWLMYYGMARPLAQIQRHIDDLSEGKLSSMIEAHGDSEDAMVKHALRILQTNLRLLVSQIKETTGLVNRGARQIASGNAQLSARTETQHSSLEHAAASLHRLTVTVTENSANAHEANELAMATSGLAAKGGRAVGQVIQTMGSIKECSRKIADIIGVIDAIAFQTSILALNAAVEAAHAGEQGRGFAVVASEVSTLARRSADAAREIKSLIGDAVDKVEAGSELVDHAGAAIADIVAAVERVTSFMGDISQASREQSLGIGKVNKTVLQLEKVTQQNAQLVEQAELQSRHMQGQAGKLAQLVSSFKLSEAQAEMEFDRGPQ